MHNIIKFVFWSPVDPTVQYYLKNNPSLDQISQQYPHLFVTSNGIDQLVKQLHPNAIIINSKNDMRCKGTTAFQYMRTIKFDVCIRLDVDAILFDLNKLINMTQNTKPNQFLGCKKRFKKLRIVRRMNTKHKYPFKIRGACHAIGRDIIERIKPLGTGPHFDEAMSANAVDAGAELIDCHLFELNAQYTGASPVWHPPRGTKEGGHKKSTFKQHTKIYNSHDT